MLKEDKPIVFVRLTKEQEALLKQLNEIYPLESFSQVRLHLEIIKNHLTFFDRYSKTSDTLRILLEYHSLIRQLKGLKEILD